MNSPADFHITETPTLHFVATGDEQRLSRDLDARLNESLKRVEEQPEVAAAVEANRKEADRVQQLKAAERGLHQYARDSGMEMARAAEQALDQIIISAAAGKPNFAGIKELSGAESRNRYTGRALER